MAFDFSNLLSLGKAKNPKVGNAASQTTTFTPGAQGGILAAPQYQDHLTDIFSSRQSSDSRTLMKSLFQNDPDVSAAVNSYLTLANTPMLAFVRDVNGQIDREASKSLAAFISALTEPFDYSQGFQLKPDLHTLTEELRYMALLRGACGGELVFDKGLLPNRIQQLDMGEVRWTEINPGIYKPYQVPKGGSGGQSQIMLDFPTIAIAYHRRDPTAIYPASTFVAAVNTIAARQMVINELYRIMQVTGFPRMDIEVAEAVVLNNAPADVRADGAKQQNYVRNFLSSVSAEFGQMRSDQAFVHTDAVKPGVMNQKGAGVALNIQPVIDTLNAQNQAALKDDAHRARSWSIGG